MSDKDRPSIFRDSQYQADVYSVVDVIKSLAENHPDVFNLSQIKEDAIKVLNDEKAAPEDKNAALAFAEYLKTRIANEGDITEGF